MHYTRNPARYRFQSPNRAIDVSTRSLEEISAELDELRRRVDELATVKGQWFGEERRRPVSDTEQR